MRTLLKDLLFRKQTNILSAASVIMAIYGLSHFIGLIKTRLLITYFFGSQASQLDVYYAAFVIPDTIFQLLVIGSLSAAFIPTFTKYLNRSESEAWDMASATMNMILSFFFVLSVLIFIFAVPLSRIIAPGFNPSQILAMSGLLRIMLFAQLIFVVSGFLTSVIQSHQRFLIPALAPVMYNLGIILGTILLSKWGILGPTLGVVIGAFFHFIIQLPLALKLGFRFSLRPFWRHPGAREVLRLMPPRTIALGIDQIEQFVAVFLTSLLPVGSLSLLNVARLLYALPASLFGVAIGQAALPTLSRQAASSDHREFWQTLVDSLLQIAFFALPLSVLFIILRIPVVRLIFGAPSFPWAATLLTGKTLAVLASSAAFSAVMQLVIRGFHALHDTKTPLIVGLLAALFDCVFGFVAVKHLGLGIIGIALAISITAFLETLVLFFLLNRRLGFVKELLPKVLVPVSKIIVAGFLTGLALWIPMRLLDQFVFDTTHTLPLIGLTLITSFIGLSFYLFLAFIFRIDQLTSLVGLLRRLLDWRKLVSPAPAEPIIVPAPDQN